MCLRADSPKKTWRRDCQPRCQCEIGSRTACLPTRPEWKDQWARGTIRATKKAQWEAGRRPPFSPSRCSQSETLLQDGGLHSCADHLSGFSHVPTAVWIDDNLREEQHERHEEGRQSMTPRQPQNSSRIACRLPLSSVGHRKQTAHFYVHTPSTLTSSIPLTEP